MVIIPRGIYRRVIRFWVYFDHEMQKADARGSKLFRETCTNVGTHIIYVHCTLGWSDEKNFGYISTKSQEDFYSELKLLPHKILAP